MNEQTTDYEIRVEQMSTPKSANYLVRGKSAERYTIARELKMPRIINSESPIHG